MAMKKEALRVVTQIPVAPTTLYFAWIDSEQHTAMTGGQAKISGEVGSKFSAWNGYISGKLITLDLGRRIIMSWRTTDFPRDASDSKVEIHLEAIGGSTRVTILHTDIPEGQAEKYRAGWNDHYFTPMRTHFSKYLPDPRKPPPPRRPPPPPEDDEEEETPPPKAAKGKPGKKVPPPPPSKGPGVAKAPAAKAPPSAKGKSAAPPPPAKGKAAPAPAKGKPAAKPAAKPAPKPAAKPAKKAAKPAPKAKPKPAKKKK